MEPSVGYSELVAMAPPRRHLESEQLLTLAGLSVDGGTVDSQHSPQKRKQ